MESDKYEEETRRQYQEYITREHNGKLEVKYRKKSSYRQGEKTPRNRNRLRQSKDLIGD